MDGAKVDEEDLLDDVVERRVLGLGFVEQPLQQITLESTSEARQKANALDDLQVCPPNRRRACPSLAVVHGA